MAAGERFEFYMEQRPSDRLLDSGPWVEAKGGGMAGSVLVRIGRSADGRPIVTGLVLGNFDDREITPDTLRGIRLGALVGQLFEDFDPNEPPGLHEDMDDQVVWGLMHEQLWEPAAEPTGPAEATGRGPSVDLLRTFAEAYRRETVRNPRRAMTATAEAMNISRPTANRWADACRKLNLLPRKEK